MQSPERIKKSAKKNMEMVGEVLLVKQLLFGMHMRMAKNYLSKRKSFCTYTFSWGNGEER